MNLAGCLSSLRPRWTLKRVNDDPPNRAGLADPRNDVVDPEVLEDVVAEFDAHVEYEWQAFVDRAVSLKLRGCVHDFLRPAWRLHRDVHRKRLPFGRIALGRYKEGKRTRKGHAWRVDRPNPCAEQILLSVSAHIGGVSEEHVPNFHRALSHCTAASSSERVTSI